MLLSLIAVLIVLAAWALSARWLERRRVTMPMLLVIAGVVVGLSTHDALATALNGDVAQHAAEIVLAVLLFIDATDVRGGLFGQYPRSAARLLFVAMPLSLAAAVVLGLWLLPGLSWALLLIVACVVVPIDFAPAAATLRDPRIPERVRTTLNVEGGYNDGIVSPVFIFALVLAGDQAHAGSPLEALGAAVPQALKAILVGVLVGAGLALASNRADGHNLMTDQSRRLILVAAPLLAFSVSTGIHGNGFVSAFVCGIAYNYLRRSRSIAHELELVDDVGLLLAVAMWFVFGATAVLALSSGVTVGMVVFCLLALTVVRIVPVLLSLIGSQFSWPERLLLGWLGPRGTASIVFGLLAFNILPGEAEQAALITMVVVVLGSVVLHGAGAPAAARAFARSQATKLSS